MEAPAGLVPVIFKTEKADRLAPPCQEARLREATPIMMAAQVALARRELALEMLVQRSPVVPVEVPNAAQLTPSSLVPQELKARSSSVMSALRLSRPTTRPI
jgi:hypothetical protein